VTFVPDVAARVYGRPPAESLQEVPPGGRATRYNGHMSKDTSMTVEVWNRNARRLEQYEATLVETNSGREVEHRGKNRGAVRTIKINRTYDVIVDGIVVGMIEYRMFTRETRTAGRMYVNSRWESPAWGFATGENTFIGRQMEAPTKAEAVKRVVERFANSY
jgi:hypothetical protein